MKHTHRPAQQAGTYREVKLKTSVTLDREVVAAVEAVARSGESRSQVIERLLRQNLAARTRSARGRTRPGHHRHARRRAQRGSARCPPLPGGDVKLRLPPSHSAPAVRTNPRVVRGASPRDSAPATDTARPERGIVSEDREDAPAAVGLDDRIGPAVLAQQAAVPVVAHAPPADDRRAGAEDADVAVGHVRPRVPLGVEARPTRRRPTAGPRPGSRARCRPRGRTGGCRHGRRSRRPRPRNTRRSTGRRTRPPRRAGPAARPGRATGHPRSPRSPGARLPSPGSTTVSFLYPLFRRCGPAFV